MSTPKKRGRPAGWKKPDPSNRVYKVTLYLSDPEVYEWLSGLSVAKREEVINKAYHDREITEVDEMIEELYEAGKITKKLKRMLEDA